MPNYIYSHYLYEDIPSFNEDSSPSLIILDNNKIPTWKIYVYGDTKKIALKFPGRKKIGESCDGSHNKYSFDNMIRKTKGLIKNLLFQFINNKIVIIYKGKIGNGTDIKKLFLIEQYQFFNSNIDFNRAFLQKTLGEIFSANLSMKKTIIKY